jgi:hypothetical protein
LRFAAAAALTSGMASRRRPRKRPTVRIVGRQTNGVIRGEAPPGTEIDAVNLSASASEPTGYHDVILIARADEKGRFVGRLPMRANDVVRVRARRPGGATGEWMQFRARGLAGLPRPVQVALLRIGLRALENGRIRVFNISPSRPIAAPGTTLAVVNSRTGARLRVTTNEKGSFPAHVRIDGAAGDILRVETVGQRPRVLGRLVTPNAPTRGLDHVQPYSFHQKIGFRPALERIRAPLFRHRPRPEDVRQSELPNCHIASASAALAHARPQFLKRLIVRLRDGAYRVRFRLLDRRRRKAMLHDVIVSAELYVRPSGELLYGYSSMGGARRTLWWPLLEKAFARLKGSYRRIGEGGCADVILQTLLGRPSRRFFVDAFRDGESERVWNELRRAAAARLPVVAGTSSYSPTKYRHTGLVPDHAYTVLSCREVRGIRYVGVRNPWGENAKAPCRARRDGFVELELDEFIRLFCVVSTVR